MRKALLSCACFFALGSSASAGNYGVVDLSGRYVIPPEYDRIDQWGISQFLAYTKIVDLNGVKFEPKKLFDRNGRELPFSKTRNGPVKTPVVVPQNCTVEFPEGDGFIVRSTPALGSRRGFCDKQGVMLLEPEYEWVKAVGANRIYAWKYSEGGGEECLLFDRKGRFIAQLPNLYLSLTTRFSDGRLLIGDLDNVAFIDVDGRIIVKPQQFHFMYPYSDGLANVEYETKDGTAVGYINTSGKLVLGPFFNLSGHAFARGFACLSTCGTAPRKLGAADRRGKMVLPVEFDSLHIGYHGLAVGRKKKRYQVIRASSGKVVGNLPTDCIELEPYSVGKDPLIPCKFDGATAEDSSHVWTGAKWGFCDTHGNVKIPAKFAWTNIFLGKYAIAYAIDEPSVRSGGLIDRKGDWVLKPDFAEVGLVSGRRVIVRASDKPQ